MTTDQTLATQNGITVADLSEFATATTEKIEAHLGILYDLAESTGNELVKSQVENIWENALELKTTADNAIGTAITARELAQAIQAQRNQVIKELSSLQTSIDTMDMDNSSVLGLIEAVEEEAWELVMDEANDQTYNDTSDMLTGMRIGTGQTKHGKYINVPRLLIDAVTGQFELNDETEGLMRQLIKALIEQEGVS